MSVVVVVEDGSGIADANSYVSVATATSMLVAHPLVNPQWLPLSADQQSAAVIQATAWLDWRFRWFGLAYTTTQALKWPRTKNYDRHGVIIPAATVPVDLQYATAVMALNWTVNNIFFTEEAEGNLESVGVGGRIQVAFQKSADITRVLGQRFPDVELILASIGTPLDAQEFITEIQGSLI